MCAGYCVLGAGYRVLALLGDVCWVLCAGCWVLALLGDVCWVLCAGCWGLALLGDVCWVLCAGCWVPSASTARWCVLMVLLSVFDTPSLIYCRKESTNRNPVFNNLNFIFILYLYFCRYFFCLFAIKIFFPIWRWWTSIRVFLDEDVQFITHGTAYRSRCLFPTSVFPLPPSPSPFCSPSSFLLPSHSTTFYVFTLLCFPVIYLVYIQTMLSDCFYYSTIFSDHTTEVTKSDLVQNPITRCEISGEKNITSNNVKIVCVTCA